MWPGQQPRSADATTAGAGVGAVAGQPKALSTRLALAGPGVGVEMLGLVVLDPDTAEAVAEGPPGAAIPVPPGAAGNRRGRAQQCRAARHRWWRSSSGVDAASVVRSRMSELASSPSLEQEQRSRRVTAPTMILGSPRRPSAVPTQAPLWRSQLLPATPCCQRRSSLVATPWRPVPFDDRGLGVEAAVVAVAAR